MTAPPSSRLVKIRNAFFSGAVLLAPLVVTLWAFRQIIDLVGGPFRPVFFFYLPESIRNRTSLDVVWDILATLVVVALVTLLGYVSRAVFGKVFQRIVMTVAEPGFLLTANLTPQDTFNIVRAMLTRGIIEPEQAKEADHGR